MALRKTSFTVFSVGQHVIAVKPLGQMPRGQMPLGQIPCGQRLRLKDSQLPELKTIGLNCSPLHILEQKSTFLVLGRLQKHRNEIYSKIKDSN